MDIINLYTKGFLLIFKIYFHNIRGTPFENHWSTQKTHPAFYCNLNVLLLDSGGA
jgi:hypothetical protein